MRICSPWRRASGHTGMASDLLPDDVGAARGGRGDSGCLPVPVPVVSSPSPGRHSGGTGSTRGKSRPSHAGANRMAGCAPLVGALESPVVPRQPQPQRGCLFGGGMHWRPVGGGHWQPLWQGVPAAAAPQAPPLRTGGGRHGSADVRMLAVGTRIGVELPPRTGKRRRRQVWFEALDCKSRGSPQRVFPK